MLKMATTRRTIWKIRDAACFLSARNPTKFCQRFKTSFKEKIKNLQSLGLYTASDPIDQNENDVSKVYRISVKDMKTIFTHGFPTRRTNRQVDFTDYHMLIRKPILEVLQNVKNLKDGDTPPRFVFYGDDGTGKSIGLCHLIHMCAHMKWLILHLPSVYSFTQSKSETEPSSWKNGRIDQPADSSIWLKAFKTVNQSFLETITTSKEYKWGRLEAIPAGTPIGRVVEQGMGRTNFATDAVGIVLKEVQQAKDVKVLYAVDEFNGLFSTSSIRNKDNEFINPQDLSFIRHFTRLLEPGSSLVSGCYAVALSRTSNFKHYVHSLEVEDQLGKMGMSLLGKHIPVQVENFTEEELYNYLCLLKQNFLFNKEITGELQAEIRFLTDGNPTEVVRLVKGH
ncbi:small ribosomal subunit protein mS29-like [Rhopilema esculentum]|uniref:small ribosomal subunit protein mS29-like n=1 Tax=Rhopilema esculentum TaxID=499914 RepID=UPI0031CF4643